MTHVNLKFITFLGEGIGWLKLNQLKKANGGGNAQESNAALLTDTFLNFQLKNN